MTDIYCGDCRDILNLCIAEKSVQCCVTSPPYFGLRDYGNAAQIGLEPTPDEYVAKMVEVFRAVRNVLKDNGTLWLNLGDSYATTSTYSAPRESAGKYGYVGAPRQPKPDIPAGLKPKDLIGIPWRVAFALQADGWYLRQDIIWHKPNPMPESVRDRCTKAHEYVFLLSKSERYFYDRGAMQEPATQSTAARLSQDVESQAGSDRVPGKTNGPMKAVGGRSKRDSFKRDDSKRAEVIPGQSVGTHRPDRAESEHDVFTRNKRSVWTVATRPYKGAHFATFPPALIEPCVLAGSRPGDLVLDPFMGSGTTAQVALQHGRRALGCELNPEYIALAHARIAGLTP